MEKLRAWWSTNGPLGWALVVGLTVRLVPLVVFPALACTRDECTWRAIARRIADGQGMTTPNDWLWAPLYPYVLAFFDFVFGSPSVVVGPQLALSLFCVVVVYDLGLRLSGEQRVGWVAAWLFALHPTLAWFVSTTWTETLYTGLLLLGVWSVAWAREGEVRRAALPGLWLALSVLLRGVATYLLPLYALALVWPAAGERWGEALRARGRQAGVLALTTVLLVAPYSVVASQRHGGLVISDASLGQPMWLGNNDFEPLTFDYGNGLNTTRSYELHTDPGRAHCDSRLPAAQWNRCEVERGLGWIRENPGTFFSRMPLRVSQLVNPHTFLTRHIRWGKWHGLPWLAKEAMVLFIALSSYLVLVGGTIGAWARARGAKDVLPIGIVAYHVAVTAALFGMSRFRVPLEPLWMLYLAWGLARPRQTWQVLARQPVRLVGAVLTSGVLLVLMQRFFWHGFPGWGGQ